MNLWHSTQFASPIEYLMDDSFYQFLFNIIAIVCIFPLGEIMKLENNPTKKFQKL